MTDEELLSEHGWVIECESPFEIRHLDGSFATLNAAHTVVRELRRSTPEPDYEGLCLHVETYNKMGLPVSLSDMVRLADKYNCEVPDLRQLNLSDHDR